MPGQAGPCARQTDPFPRAARGPWRAEPSRRIYPFEKSMSIHKHVRSFSGRYIRSRGSRRTEPSGLARDK